MVKVFVLLFIILLTIMSTLGYMYIADEIIAGEMQIADGQRQLKEGQPQIDDGRKELKAGQREYSDGKKKYEDAEDNLFLVLADKLLKGGSGFRRARARLAEGKKKIEIGKNNISDGQKLFDSGKLDIIEGKSQLRLAKYACLSCASGAALFAFSGIVLGLFWRRSLIRIFKYADVK